MTNSNLVLQVGETQQNSGLWDIKQAASYLDVSDSWIRRHKAELPAVAVGRLVRFDPGLLSEQFQTTIAGGKSLKPERKPMLSRYQRGFVFQTGKKQKVWYGVYREDIENGDGTITRRQRKVRLGTSVELPTKNSARNRLAEFLHQPNAPEQMTFSELVERWKKAEGPSMKETTLTHYEGALRAYVQPFFGATRVSDINREQVQMFLNNQAVKYSRSSLRSMRVVLSLTLKWSAQCGWIEKNPCAGVKLPKKTAGKTIRRSVLTEEQINALAAKLEEPYSTLVQFLAVSGLRISEAIGIKMSDFEGNLLHIDRRINEGKSGELKSASARRTLPIDDELLARLKTIAGDDWVFSSRNGTPINCKNALRRYVRPAASALNIEIGGWHDLRHTLTTKLRRNGVHPKVVSAILGHSKVDLALNTYDHANVDDFRTPLAVVADDLLRDVTKAEAVNGEFVNCRGFGGPART